MLINLLKLQYSRNESMFLLGYSMYVAAISFWTNAVPFVSHALKGMALFFLILAFFFKRLNKRNILVFLCVITISLIPSLMVHNVLIILLTLFMVSARRVKVEHIVKIDLFVRLLGFVGNISLYYVGFLPDSVMYRAVEGGWKIRHSLGYYHPNICFFMWFVIVCDFLYLLYPKLKFSHLLALLLLSYYVQNETQNRTGFILISFLMFLLYVERKRHFFQLHTKARTLLYSAFPICAALSFLLMKIYERGGVLAYTLNTLITNRLSGMYYYWTTYGPSILPQSVVKVGTLEAEKTGERAYILDNLYFNFFITIGLLYGIMFGFLYYKTMKNLVKQGNVPLCLILFIFAVFGVTEGITINVDYNYFFAIAASMLFYHNFGEQKRGEFNA